MQFAARRLRIWSWFALLAMLFGASMPTLGGALAAERSSDSLFAAVCSAAAMTSDSSGAAQDSGPEDPAASSASSCAFCLAGAHGFAPPPARHAAFAAPGAHEAAIAACGPLVHRIALRHPSQPRAPPASL